MLANLCDMPYISKTHVGRVRTGNEDSHHCDPELGLYVVADGMGGHEAGEVASGIAVDVICREIRKGNDMQSAIQQAHESIMADPEGRGKPGMGSTVVAALVRGVCAEVHWVGDSRAYKWTPDLHNPHGRLFLVSRDHTPVQDAIEEGRIREADAKDHPGRHLIHQALGVPGVGNRIQVESTRCFLMPGERLLLCTDGLTGEMPEGAIAAALAVQSLPKAAERLIEGALEGGGADNITVAVIEAEPGILKARIGNRGAG